MKKVVVAFVVAIMMFAIAHPQTSYAASYADGSYDVSFEIKDASGDNTSIANGYFLNPAKVIIENGNYYVQFTVKNSEWIKSLSTSYGEGTTVSEDKASDKRTVKLQVPHIDQLIDLNMHIVVPEEVAQMEYDNHHKTKLSLDISNIPTASSNGSEQTNENSSDTEVTPEVNPKTGDEAPIVLFAFLAILSLLFLVFRNKLFTKEH